MRAEAPSAGATHGRRSVIAVSTYGTRTPAHQLYDDIANRSSDHRERLAELHQMAAAGNVAPAIVDEVREWLWADVERDGQHRRKSE
jgi:hypothetical protein